MPPSINPFTTTADDAPGTGTTVSAGMLYDDWLVAEAETALALGAWNAAPLGRKAAAYAEYAAALDAEAAAAAELAQWLAAAR